MTIFFEIPTHTEKPRYLLIADGLTNAIREGKLKPGDRLPPHRELADQLKVTVGTVTRAYSEVEKWGLIRGEVGRGTYVRDPESTAFQFGIHGEEAIGMINLSMNLPAMASAAQEHEFYSQSFRELANHVRLVELMH
jgi:DNA-binding GntR family transcriptional regulator